MRNLLLHFWGRGARIDKGEVLGNFVRSLIWQVRSLCTLVSNISLSCPYYLMPSYNLFNRHVKTLIKNSLFKNFLLYRYLHVYNECVHDWQKVWFIIARKTLWKCIVGFSTLFSKEVIRMTLYNAMRNHGTQNVFKTLTTERIDFVFNILIKGLEISWKGIAFITLNCILLLGDIPIIKYI